MSFSRSIAAPNCLQANILVTNGTPPSACLADFGLATIAVDPDQSHLISLNVEVDGGTPRFMSPERLAPETFGMMSSTPTRESDIYAFGMTILEAR
jgi:serine/threonine protein kinase